MALWRQDQTELIPMGYLISGPVGTGKTFLVKCLAGEAGVPVVVLKNFRDKWYGSTGRQPGKDLPDPQGAGSMLCVHR
ncbi:MAG: ATP-binding protein [Verrucomicrobia bacterium]|nr:ATP-binding protein [Verrucomicrobiota bacterium]